MLAHQSRRPPPVGGSCPVERVVGAVRGPAATPPGPNARAPVNRSRLRGKENRELRRATDIVEAPSVVSATELDGRPER